MGQKLTNAPVYYTVAQVKFNTFENLEHYVPALQERLIRMGYPDFERHALATFNFAFGPGGQILPQQVSPQASFPSVTQLTFSNMHRTAGFVLDKSSLTYQTSDYDVFQTFSSMLAKGLSEVNDVLRLVYSSRIGVRMLDAVYPRENETLSQYLTESVLGLCDKLDGKLAHSFTETVVDTPAARVVSRTIIEDGPVGFPPDLQPVALQLRTRFLELKGLHATLDTDGWKEARLKFDVSEIVDKLTEIQEEVSKSFKASTTKFAREEVWQ